MLTQITQVCYAFQQGLREPFNRTSMELKTHHLRDPVLKPKASRLRD